MSEYIAKYDKLPQENKLLFAVDLVKEKLTEAYQAEIEPVMSNIISGIMGFYKAICNKQFNWFRRMLVTHIETIIMHATFKSCARNIEGINYKIKNLRKQGYEYTDDWYFCLKLVDISRKSYVRNIPSHKILE